MQQFFVQVAESEQDFRIAERRFRQTVHAGEHHRRLHKVESSQYFGFQAVQFAHAKRDLVTARYKRSSQWQQFGQMSVSGAQLPG